MKSKFILPIAVGLILIIVAVYFLYPAQIAEYQMDVKVQKPMKIGFNIDDDALHFGIVPPGSNAVRSVVIENNQGSRFVVITKTGDFADWVSISENNFILEPLTDKKINFRVTIPSSAEQGNYTGSITVKFYRR
jgi:hypothetical protein